MRKIKEILRQKYDAGLSARQIARSCSISHSTVNDVLRRAIKAKLAWPLPEELDESALEAMIYPPVKTNHEKSITPDWVYIHLELRRKDVTLLLLWEEYKQKFLNGYQYSQFCDLYRQWRCTLSVVMHQIHRAGEKLFVDWAGSKVNIIDVDTGEIKEASVFVATLGASSYSYAEAFMSEKLESWITAHCHAFEYFEGVTAIIVPDNTKTAVLKPCRYEPELNLTYLEMATYYGAAIIPAWVRKPKHKAKVESGVQVVQRWILAALRNRQFFSIHELNQAVSELLVKLNRKPFRKLNGSRHSLFLSLDRPALKPLPQKRYEFAQWKKARVNIDSHIECDKHFYSVPYQLLRKELDLRFTATTIEIFNKGSRIVSHQRSYAQNPYVTVPEHLPETQRKYLEWNPERISDWAKTIGPNTSKLIDSIMESKQYPEQGFRACMGIINLGKHYSKERLEAAATRALVYHIQSYKRFKSILENKSDQLPLELPLANPPAPHRNLRGSAYFTQNKEEQ